MSVVKTSALPWYSHAAVAGFSFLTQNWTDFSCEVSLVWTQNDLKNRAQVKKNPQIFL